jgi:uncharacterized membrane protein
MSLIDPHNVLAQIAVIFALTWAGFLADASRCGKIIPGVLVILAGGALLSNLKITPYSSPVADFIGNYVVAAAIPMLMIKADLRKIFVESGRVMIGFAAACIGIVVGVLIGYCALQPWHVGARVAGFYAGAFIGGTISMVAVANAVKMSAAEIATATGASMIPSVLALMALIAAPNLAIVRRHLPMRVSSAASGAGKPQDPAAPVPQQFPVTHVSAALAIALIICALAQWVEAVVARSVGHDQGQYHILYVTALTVLVANLAPRQLARLRGEFELGMILMYTFFAIIGLGTNVTAFLDNAVSLFFYVLMLLAIGMTVCLVLSRLLRLDLPEAITGCGAAIVGPVATVAVVAGKGWNTMISPAVMTGIFCHIVGNFVGITVATVLR